MLRNPLWIYPSWNHQYIYRAKTVSFSGGNKVSTAVIPNTSTKLITGIKRNPATVTLTGIIVELVASLTSDNLYERMAEIRSAMALNTPGTLYLATTGSVVGGGSFNWKSVSDLQCSIYAPWCFCSSFSFDVDIHGHLLQTYSVTFTLPNGLIKYSPSP